MPRIAVQIRITLRPRLCFQLLCSVEAGFHVINFEVTESECEFEIPISDCVSVTSKTFQLKFASFLFKLSDFGQYCISYFGAYHRWLDMLLQRSITISFFEIFTFMRTSAVSSRESILCTSFVWTRFSCNTIAIRIFFILWTFILLVVR